MGSPINQRAVIVENYRQLAKHCREFIAFELGQVFAPFGAIYDLDIYEQLMRIDNCFGAKHSSLRRQPEWDRLALRDRSRKEFMVLTGNDLAIDMVMYGSDYLLGLSTFAPDAFALRDAYLARGRSTVLRTERRVAIPRLLRLPRADTGVQTRRGDVPAPARLAHQ